jgi:hypothetical protein
MAKAVGLDAEEWVLRVQADREIVPARKQVWLRAARRLAQTAAVIALAFGLDVQTAHATGNLPVNDNATPYTLCEHVGMSAAPLFFGKPAPRQSSTSPSNSGWSPAASGHRMGLTALPTREHFELRNWLIAQPEDRLVPS